MEEFGGLQVRGAEAHRVEETGLVEIAHRVRLVEGGHGLDFHPLQQPFQGLTEIGIPVLQVAPQRNADEMLPTSKWRHGFPPVWGLPSHHTPKERRQTMSLEEFRAMCRWEYNLSGNKPGSQG